MSLQETIIQELGVKPVIDAQEEIRRSIDFLKRYLKKHPFLKTFVLGISGGQDSTLAGRLAQLAMEELRAETGDDSYKFIAVRLPYGVQADEADAQKALAFIQPDVSLVVNIKESADAMTAAVEATGSPVSDFNKGNIKARCRMIAQYALAGSHSGAVIGTDTPRKISQVSLPSLVTAVRIFSLFTASINAKENSSCRNLAQSQPFMKKSQRQT